MQNGGIKGGGFPLCATEPHVPFLKINPLQDDPDIIRIPLTLSAQSACSGRGYKIKVPA